MEIRQLLHTVRANWVVALVTFVVCLGLGAAYAVLPAKTYSASVVLLAQPPAGASDPGGDVSAIQIEIPQITVEAENQSIDQEARAQVPARFQALPVTIAATADPTTNSVTITASSTDPAAAQAFANATAARVVKVTNRDAGSYLELSELGPAELPTTPTNPRGTVAVAAVAFGLIAAIFAALAAGALRRSVGVEEISERLGLPILGQVPPLLHAGSNPADMFKLAGDERGLEAFQQLRSHLYLMFQESHPPVIAFTSCDPLEGKSCVASHTAWALATPGQFVVAVDGDLREPSLHEIFDVALSPGVSDIAVASGPSELLVATGNRYLELIPAGVPTRHPADIAAADLPRLLRALRESDRTVVLDCPPITGVAETTILVAKADAVVLVVDARKPNFETLQHGLAQIRESGGNVVGIVLNRVRRRSVTADYSYSRPENPPSTNGSSRDGRGVSNWADRGRSESPTHEGDQPERARQG
jgi:succinoglycan biosynthesis transport protein ExoP